MKNSIQKLVVSLSLAMLLAQPVMAQQEGSNKKVEIVRLFMHRVNEFSVAIKKADNSLEFQSIPSMMCEHFTCQQQVFVVVDVPNDKAMYVEYMNYTKPRVNGNGYAKAVIHIHSAEEVNGGGYTLSSGKNGITKTQVQTTVVR